MPSSESANAAWPQLVLVILLTAGAVLLAPIQSERPITSGHGIRSGALEDVDLRLWQDPFDAVAKAAQNKKSTDCVANFKLGIAGQLQVQPCPQKGAEGIAVLGEQIALRRHQSAVKVLVTMIDGSTAVLADEKRRRTRYAVLAGLNAQGYAPVDAEHIGYTAEENVYRARVSLAFEWLKDDSGKSAVLLIWLDEQSLSQEIILNSKDKNEGCPDEQNVGSGFNVCPMNRLKWILEKLGQERLQAHGTLKELSFAVIGPSSSSFLVAAAKEKMLKEAADTLRNLKVNWFSPFATLPESELKNQEGKKPELPNFQRVIASDDLLVKALIKELKIRHFGSGKAMALVGQWDTAYSRNLRKMLEEGKPDDIRVEVASYLRGLDGRLPGKEGSDKEKSDKDRKKSVVTERPEGESQIDYLRRLALHLQDREKEVGRIGAIGVLGNDYYDKLLVLQALRPAFPDAVFFTTDLDAAMLHEKDNPYTRNLIVASGYGLSLNPVIQKDIPPFRDSYQSAAYLAAQLVSSKDAHLLDISALIKPWLEPQLFEIGRNAAVPLLQVRNAAVPIAQAPEQVQCKHLLDCNNPHVGASTTYDISPYVVPLGILVAWIMGMVSGLIRHHQSRYWLAVFLLSMAASLLAKLDVGGEPLVWLQGVSIWPSEFLRIAAFALALILIFRSMRQLRETREQLNQGYFNRHVIANAQAAPVLKHRKPWWWLMHLLAEWRACLVTLRQLLVRCCEFRPTQRKTELSAEVIWDSYNRDSHDTDTPSFLRLPYWFNGGVFIASMLLLGGVLGWMGLPMPKSPIRGDYAFYSNLLVIICVVLSFQSLLFLAVYESFRAIWLARALLGPTRWPAAAISAYWPVAAGSAKHCNLDAWLDVRFIATVTEPVQRIIFYPFPVLVLMILARSSLFDRWHIPVILWVIFLTSILLIVLAALRLRWSAEAVRNHSVERLSDQYLQAKACEEKELAEQIAAMLSQIKELKTGAFAPLSHQPLVKAVLTIAGSVSGIALLEYASLANA